MTATPISTIQAIDKRGGLTVADLVVWTNQLREMGVDPRSTVQARMGFRGQLLEVKPRPYEEPTG
ncbi:hypothetical protein [Kocuria rhizophila]|uniref:hypothetical protein n=1 Tax=Kocuria rhizophila TaxID=72000 RepID=UPI000313A3D7|nr:hypothetical protein [Kocuria rhizophila]